MKIEFNKDNDTFLTNIFLIRVLFRNESNQKTEKSFLVQTKRFVVLDKNNEELLKELNKVAFRMLSRYSRKITYDIKEIIPLDSENVICL